LPAEIQGGERVVQPDLPVKGKTDVTVLVFFQQDASSRFGFFAALLMKGL
jgi:hypothetical protein